MRTYGISHHTYARLADRGVASFIHRRRKPSDRAIKRRARRLALDEIDRWDDGLDPEPDDCGGCDYCVGSDWRNYIVTRV